MWAQDEIWGMAERAGGRERFGFVDIERSACDASFVQGAGERRLVHKRPARGVDEMGARLHEPKLGLTEEVTVLFGGSGVDGDKVARPQEIIEGEQRNAEFGSLG